jgi:glycosyltransferase involved in cell wall biosynthesis
MLIPKKDVTVVITSRKRYHLLEITLKSFFKFNTYKGIRDIIVVEDGEEIPLDFQRKFSNVKFIHTGENVGQTRAVDYAYSFVKTELIFHCEDDWQFYAGGFIEESKEILKRESKCLLVWLRAHNDTNQHPHKDGIMALDCRGVWHGFTFNPALRRTSDYKFVAPFNNFAPFNFKVKYESEMLIGKKYRQFGYYARISEKKDGYVKHIG